MRRCLVSLVVALLWLVPAHAQDSSRSAAELMDAVMWGKEPIGGPFKLTDTDGKERTNEEFRGRLMLIYFGFTSCPDICPTDLQAMGLALDRLGEAAGGVQPIFITLDPERDSRAYLAEYVKMFHPKLIGLTGDMAAIAAAARDYRVYHTRKQTGDALGYTIDHSSFVYLMGQNGEYLGFFPPGTPPERMAAAMKPQLVPR